MNDISGGESGCRSACGVARMLRVKSVIAHVIASRRRGDAHQKRTAAEERRASARRWRRGRGGIKSVKAQ